MKGTTITPRRKWSAETLGERLLPTLIRFNVQIYDHTGRVRVYRQMRGMTAAINVHSMQEIETLWSAFQALLADPGWHDECARLSGAGVDLGEGSNGEVDATVDKGVAHEDGTL